MSDRLLSSYDELPYSCHPVHLSHPDNLACKALLYGLRAPDVRTCRVLELGCGTGGNLLPLAQSLPQASLVGIDYAKRQIMQGKAIAETVGLKNLDLRAMSLADFDDQLGVFDYILCHGVYSWVSLSNQQQILRIIQQHLAPNGVAFVSYNTYPGWHLRGLIREIVCHQTAGTSNPTDQVQKARKYLDFLIANTPEQDGIYANILRREREIFNKTPDTYVFHEHLEELNQPVYFHEFAKRAASHSLQFLCEASFHPEEANFSDALREQLNSIARDRIDYEQQIDFLCNGTFRRTLLCHSSIPLAGQPSTMALGHVRLATRARPSRPISDVGAATAEEFLGAHGETITTTHPLIKAALLCLAEAWPRSLSLDELQDCTTVKLNTKPDPIQHLHETELLAKAILRCHQTDLIQLQISEPSCALQVSERPMAPSLVRWQAIQQEPVTNLTHEIVDVNDFDRYVLSLLDGTRDHRELCQAVINHVAQGNMALQHQGKPVDDPELIAVVVDQSLSQSFKKFIDLCLLVQ